MNNITEKAIKVITYLQDQHEKGKTFYGHDTFTIYIPKEYITTLEDLLIAHQKQAKLLELYKKLSNLYEELYTKELSFISLNRNYYEIEVYKIKQQIKELEK